MKPTTLVTALQLLGTLIMFAGVFNKPLGLRPETSGAAIVGFGVLLMLAALAVQRRALRLASMPTPTPATQAQNLKKVRLLGIGVSVCVSLTSPFLMPYMGIHLPMQARVVVSIVTGIFLVVVCYFGTAIRWKG